MDGAGVFDLVSGDHYEGMFRKGMMEGLGVRKFADGSRYEGEFRKNQEEGLGTLTLANHASYEGEFHANRPDGQAVVTDEGGIVYQGTYVDGHVDGLGILTKPNGERDVGVFRESKGTLKVVSTLGPSLYEPCQTQCNTITSSCSGNAIASITPDDPMYQIKVTNAAVSCGRDLQQCVTMCEQHNPTARELKGIVEVGEIDDPKPSTQADHAVSDSKISDSKAALSFTDRQAAATNELHKRLTQQRQQLQTLQQKIAGLPVARTAATASPGKSATECKSVLRRTK
jgi:hypothetical protein